MLNVVVRFNFGILRVLRNFTRLHNHIIVEFMELCLFLTSQTERASGMCLTGYLTFSNMRMRMSKFN